VKLLKDNLVFLGGGGSGGLFSGRHCVDGAVIYIEGEVAV